MERKQTKQRIKIGDVFQVTFSDNGFEGLCFTFQAIFETTGPRGKKYFVCAKHGFNGKLLMSLHSLIWCDEYGDECVESSYDSPADFYTKTKRKFTSLSYFSRK